MRFSILLVGLLASLAVLRAATPAPLPDDPACTEADHGYMKRAYELAAEAVKKGNAPFGALFVLDGQVIAEFTNSGAINHDPTRHAELGLISAFGPKIDRPDWARGILYASSEPCTMCSGTTESQVCLIIGEPTAPKPLTCREVMMRNRPEVEVRGPLMEKEGLAQHAAYWPEMMKKWKKP